MYLPLIKPVSASFGLDFYLSPVNYFNHTMAKRFKWTYKDKISGWKKVLCVIASVTK
jgi:hypothetical protein